MRQHIALGLNHLMEHSALSDQTQVQGLFTSQRIKIKQFESPGTPDNGGTE
jgi:hypothetical protein